MFYICQYCHAKLDDYPSLVLHRQRWHWKDYFNDDKVNNFAQVAAEGMIGYSDPTNHTNKKKKIIYASQIVN